MDFIRRKYLIHTIDGNIDFLKTDVVDKINNFSLQHVLALYYIIYNFSHHVLTREVFSNVNFFIFLHVVKKCDLYDIVLKTSFDVTTLYIKAVVKNYNAFADVITTYRDACQYLITDSKFLETIEIVPSFDGIIGVNYDLTLNPLFHRNEPIRDMEIVFTKLFHKTDFYAVRALPVLRLLVWAYLSKQDTGIVFPDNDAQDIFSVYQRSGPIINSEMTERFKSFMFSTEKTSYWVWLKDSIADDKTIIKSRLARTMYERVLAYIYSELKQGRVNKNMLKLVYIFENDNSIRKLMLEIIYDVPGDILGIIDSEDDTWKKYFIGLYAKKFVDGKTFTTAQTFHDDLFTVVAAIDPTHFSSQNIRAIFNATPEIRTRFDDIDINDTYIYNMIYNSPDIDMIAIYKNYACQIYNEDTDYYIKEYNTYLFLTETDPIIIHKGNMIRLSTVPKSHRIELFSKHILKYYVDGNLARLGIILTDYSDIITQIISHTKCIEDITSFVRYATCRDKAIIPAVVKTIISHFNISVIVRFRSFLLDNIYYVNDVLDKSEHLTRRDKNYILQIINNGRA